MFIQQLRGRNTQVNAKIPLLGVGNFYNCVHTLANTLILNEVRILLTCCKKLLVAY
jgi:hypothetical protein